VDLTVGFSVVAAMCTAKNCVYEITIPSRAFGIMLSLSPQGWCHWAFPVPMLR
jgi:hypothetical protein